MFADYGKSLWTFKIAKSESLNATNTRNMMVCRFYQHQEAQKEVLARQLKLALEINKPIVIHSREAEDDILTELEKVRPLQSSAEFQNVPSLGKI